MEHKYKSVVGTKGIEEKSIPGGDPSGHGEVLCSDESDAGRRTTGGRSSSMGWRWLLAAWRMAAWAVGCDGWGGEVEGIE